MATTFKIRQLVASDEQKKSRAALESIPELKGIETALGRAFAKDTFTATVIGKQTIGGDTSFIGPFWLTTVLCGLLGGEVYVAETNNEQRIVGCAVWFGPGRAMYDSADQQEMVLGPLMSEFPADLQEWWQSKFLPQYDAFSDATLGPGIKHGAWHLQTIGVDPDYHRRGIAGMLIEAVAQKVANNQALVLECEVDQNVGIYTALGFEMVLHKDKKDVLANPTRKDYSETFVGVNEYLEFPMWVMRRQVNNM